MTRLFLLIALAFKLCTDQILALADQATTIPSVSVVTMGARFDEPIYEAMWDALGGLGYVDGAPLKSSSEPLESFGLHGPCTSILLRLVKAYFGQVGDTLRRHRADPSRNEWWSGSISQKRLGRPRSAD